MVESRKDSEEYFKTLYISLLPRFSRTSPTSPTVSFLTAGFISVVDRRKDGEDLVLKLGLYIVSSLITIALLPRGCGHKLANTNTQYLRL